jgi:flavin reductase (DIM6/NTAB) family NADH-FMN oxidoreductase RutF
MSSIDPRLLRDACGQFCTGVTVITTRCEEGDHGMTANAFMSISLDPPHIAISIGEKAKMLRKIQMTGRFAVSVLAAGMEDFAWHFAGRPKEDVTGCFEHRQGLPLVRGAAAHFLADVVDEILAGDHTIFIGHVQALSRDPDKKPLLFFAGRFGELAAPQPARALMEDFEHGLIW